MTDQTRIPMPEGGDEPDPKQASLLERATGMFGLGGLRPAPVPKDLAHRHGPKPARKSRPAPAAPAASDDVPLPPRGAASIDSAQQQAAPAARAAPVAKPVIFTGPTQAIDRAHLEENGFIIPGGPVSGLLEEFRIVKRQVLQSARNAGPGKGQRVLVCSPLPNEGKTFCATNLALAIAAEKDSEVLLVDADFAKPSVLSTLGLPGGKGLMDALANPEIPVEDCVIATDVSGLWVLPAGNRTNSDSEIVASSRTAEVLDRLIQGVPNRIVIFDSPPALAASPAAELAKHVGQSVLVVRADRTGQSALEDALHLLSSCSDIKLLLNDTNFSPSGRQFGDYYGYGG